MSEISLTPSMRQNLLSLQATAKLMGTTQSRIATGRKVNTALDNPTAFFTALGLTNKASDLSTLKDSMGQGISTIESADKALGSITKLVEQMKGITASAKAATTSAERSTLATQYDDLRNQIDKLATDATYSGKNLVSGRGTISGGTFLDTIAAAETALSGVSTGGITRTGTDTGTGSYTVDVQQKVADLGTVITGTGDIMTTSVQAGAGGSTSTNADSLEFFVDGVSVGIAAIADVTVTGTAYAAVIDALSGDLTAVISGSNLKLTVASGKVLEVREKVATNAGALLADLGITAGLQNDNTGAQVKDLTADLGIYGAEVYAHISGYTDNVGTNTTFAVSGTGSSQILTVTDGTGQSATINTSVFSAAGTDTLSVGDLTINFVTSTATEQLNTAPTVAAGATAVAQVSTVTIASDAGTAQVDTITISGVIEKGDVFSATVDGTTYSYTATASRTAAQVATSLAGVISTNPTGVTGTASGSTVILTGTAGTAFIATSATVDRVLDTSQSLASSSTTAGIVTTLSTLTSNIAYSLGGNAIAAGDSISVTLDTSAGTFTGGANTGLITYTALASDTTLTNMMTGLVNKINASTSGLGATNGIGAVTASNSAGKLVLTTKYAGDSFSATATITGYGITIASGAGEAAPATEVRVATTGNAIAETFLVSGNVDKGDTYSFTLDPSTAGGSPLAITGAAVTVSYTAIEGDTTSIVASNIRGLITASTLSSSVTVTGAGANIILTENGTSPFGTFGATTAFKTTGTAAANATVLDNTQATALVNTTANSKGYEVGDVMSVVINGTTYSHTVATTGTNIDVATAFLATNKTTIEAAQGVTIANNATPDGKLVVTSVNAGDAFTVTASQTVNVGDTETAPSVALTGGANLANVAQTSTVQIGANIDDGDVFSVIINGTTVSYTATAADASNAASATQVATGLKDAINATSLVSGSASLLATTTSATDTITLSENANGAVLTITAAATDAAISVGNGSSLTSTQTALKSMTTGSTTGDARVKVTSGGVTVTANVDTNSANAVTISDASFGSTFSFKGDDATMVAGETATISVTNPTGVGANDMKVFFNADNSAFVNTQAVDASSSGLTLSAAIGSFATDTNVDSANTDLTTALTSLRSVAKTLSTNLGIIKTRESFTNEFIDVLLAGGDKLTLADTNTESANMLALQTRQQLGIQSLSMASQSARSILTLFR